jgi:ubiquinone/menaquinone biosynthesis C-methylase UbiE
MNDFLGKKLNAIRVNKVMPHISGNLLDIGCGYNKLVRMYKKGTGVDVFDWGDVDLIVEDTSNLPFNDKSFDTITIIASLNHIPNRGDVIKECYRLLTDNGKIIVTMLSPGISKIWHKIREPWDEDQSARGMKEDEVFGLSKNEMISMFAKANFKIVSYKKFMFLNTLYIFSK